MDSTPDPQPDSPGRIRLVVVDDDAGIRTLLEVTVTLDPRFELLGTAASGAETLTVLSEQAGDVDLVLLDVTLPDRDGIELLADCRVAAPHARLALFTGWSDPDTRDRAHAAGADGMFPKDGDPRKLLDGLAKMFEPQTA